MPLFLLLLLAASIQENRQPLCELRQVPREFQGCYQDILDHPADYEPRFCIYTQARENGKLDEGLRFLSQCLPEDDFWATLVRGHIHRVRRNPTRSALAEGFYKRALEQSRDQADPLGQVMVSVNLRDYYFHRGRRAEAEFHIQEAQEIADRHRENKPCVAWAKISLMQHYLDLDLIRPAEAVLERYEPDFELVDIWRLQRSVLQLKRGTHVKKGEYFEAAGIALELVETAAEDSQDWVDAKYHQLRIEKMRLERDLPEGYQEALGDLVEQAGGLLESAQQVNYRRTDAIRVWLGYQKGRMQPPLRQQGQALLLETIRRSGDSEDAYFAHWGLVESYFREGRPEEALEVERAAQEIAIENDRRIQGLWVSHMLVSLHRGDWDRAEALLNEIDRARELARGTSPRMRVLAGLTDTYLWLAGHALRSAVQEQRPELRQRAFRIAERMRARMLLDEFEAAKALEEIEPGLKELTQAINRLNASLLDPALTLEEVRQVEERREELFTRRNELRYQAISQSELEEPAGRGGYAALDQIQSQLRPDQAMLSFQLGFEDDIFGHFAGGAWVLVIHRDSVQAFTTADHYWLRDKLSILEGLLDGRRPLPESVTALLYRKFLQQAVDSLPPRVEELVLIPDALLYRLPFGLLSPGRDTPPLAQRFRLSVTPSAAIWSRWRQAGKTRPSATALVLADPDLSGLPEGVTGAVERLPLPYSRIEARHVSRFMGSASEAYLGQEASEALVRSAKVEDFGVVHFAAHAVSDDENPERSAVLLSPGGAQDGRLEVREIVFLDVEDKLIVLSACQSASGQLMLGEGVLGLARAFFQARARVVVGSLWPLRDDDAAFVFKEFYRHLGQGQSVSGALQKAQVAAIEGGMPPQAWSGILVMGDGGLVPFPEGVEPRFQFTARMLSYSGLSLALVLLAGAFFIRRRRA